MDEAHVHHLVGFIENEDFRVLDGEAALIDEVEQAPRRRNDDVDAARQRLDLAIDRHAAEHGFDAQLQEAAIVAKALRDLRGQFAGRRQHQHAAAAHWRGLGMTRKIVEAGQREGRGLAGAGLRDAAQVAAFQQNRDRLLLDRRRIGVFLGGERLQDRLGQAQIGEFHDSLTCRPAPAVRDCHREGARRVTKRPA